MSTPVILYNSAGVPIGARAIVKFQRPTVAPDETGIYAPGADIPDVADVFGFGAVGTSLGLFVIENLSLQLNGTDVSRGGTFGEDLGDGSVVRGKPTLTLTAQMAAAGTPTLCPGDFIEIAIGMTAASTAATPAPMPATRWYIPTGGVSGEQNQANKFNLTLALDRVNSNPDFNQF